MQSFPCVDIGLCQYLGNVFSRETCGPCLIRSMDSRKYMLLIVQFSPFIGIHVSTTLCYLGARLNLLFLWYCLYVRFYIVKEGKVFAFQVCHGYSFE
jgi:hypothetical protein